jgi:flagella basal body P-ring formation protein FlgA
VTATGKAMEKGRLGECIKVKNIDSQRVILAKVNEDGTVEPVF